jgi:RHH-type proline utilization regulon transcriptional repressor/proline dehydrogenase/delta 1-pyrroline-5-carboxylate dehydrogenase
MGLHTRVQGRAEAVRRRAAVGNLYVNRNIIGAVVGVQPFGGEGLSGTGPKAGGPHYLQRFATERVCTINTAAAGGDVQLMTAGT